MTSGFGEEEGHADPRVAFYRDHHPRLVGYVHRRVSDKIEAEALANDAWLAFLRRFDHYRETYDDPAGPLFVIARRMIVDWRERCTPIVFPGDDGLGADLTQIAQERPDAFRLADLRFDLTRAVSRLPGRQREALHLRYVDDLDRRTVARLMGITVDGVKKLISAARQTLKAAPELVDYQPPTVFRTGGSREEVRK